MYNIPKIMGHIESSPKSKTHISECRQKKLEKEYTSRLIALLKALEQKEAFINSLPTTTTKLQDQMGFVESSI